MNDVIHGDCLDAMATFEPESIDAIVTDPPYGLGFMGKAWDHGAPGIPFWAEMLRVSRPSAYLLAFGGTRTVHRIATAIEDAGWVIRDMLVWAYASGFPKSKASLKPAWEPIVMARKPLRSTVAANAQAFGTGALNIDATRIPSTPGDVEWHTTHTPAGGKHEGWARPWMQDGVEFNRRNVEAVERANTLGRWPANVILTDPIFDGDVEGVVGGGEQRTNSVGDAREYEGGWAAGSGSGLRNRTPYNVDLEGTYSRFFTIPQSGTMCEWCGASIASASSSQPSRPATSAPSPAPTEADGMPDSTSAVTEPPTTSATVSASSDSAKLSTSPERLWPESKPSEPSPSISPVRAADRRGTSTATTTTTHGLSMCASCAGLVMYGYTLAVSQAGTAEDGEQTAISPTRFLLIPKAARSDREPIENPWYGKEVVPSRRERFNAHPTLSSSPLTSCATSCGSSRRPGASSSIHSSVAAAQRSLPSSRASPGSGSRRRPSTSRLPALG